VGPSQTAQLAAAHRAYHFRYAHPTILEDSAAGWLLGPPLSVVLRVAPLRWLFFERLLARVRPIGVFVVVRSRYAEDCLARSICEGYGQYLILGAGLDSWALRHQTEGVSVFELDHPSTQQWKEARIRARLGTVPTHLSLIPIDFDREAIADALCGQKFDRDSRAFVSWLGTIYYLTRGAIEATLASLATACAPGSRVVFDYF
jgi:methyltransferase (TIGR00027 family)